jgi:hypothetical protein
VDKHLALTGNTGRIRKSLNKPPFVLAAIRQAFAMFEDRMMTLTLSFLFVLIEIISIEKQSFIFEIRKGIG